MFFFPPNFDRPGIGPENEPPRSGFYLFFRNLGLCFFKLIGLNFLFFLVTLPIYIWFTNQVNMIAITNGIGILGMLAAVIAYVLAGVPEPVLIIAFCASAIAYGPCCAGLCYVTQRWASGQHAWALSDFRDAFRNHFRQALPVGIADILAGYASLRYLFPDGSGAFYTDGLLRVIWLLLLLIYLICRVYIYILMVRVQLPLRELLRNAILLGLLSPGRVCLVLLAAILIGILSGYLDFVLLPVLAYAFLSFFSNALLNPVLKRYLQMPDN